MRLAPALALLWGSLTGLLTGPLPAAEPLLHQDLLHHDFEADEGGWLAYGSSTARVHVTRDAALVKSGKGSLVLEYEASREKPAIAVLPVPHGLAGARSFRFWIMADAPTAEALVLTEKGHARYAALFWLDPKTWQRVELTPEDFTLGRNPGDPPDPDGHLDLDQVEAVSLIDLSQVLNAAAGEAEAPLAVTAHSGAQKIYVDDFAVGTSAPDWYKPRAAFAIDNFDHPQVNWFTLGGADLRLDASPTAGPAMKVDYEQMPDRFVLIAHLLPDIDLRGATHLEFDIASEKASELVVTLQERAADGKDGARYTAGFRVSAGGKMEHRQVALSSFELDDDGPADANGKLDLDQLKSLSFVDVDAASTQQSGVNTIRLAHLQAVKTAPSPVVPQ